MLEKRSLKVHQLIYNMRLIIKLNGEKQKFLWPGGNLEHFKEKLIKEFSLEGLFKIHFKDIDQEDIEIMDQYDFEYMISNVTDQNNFEIIVEGKAKIKENSQT